MFRRVSTHSGVNITLILSMSLKSYQAPKRSVHQIVELEVFSDTDGIFRERPVIFDIASNKSLDVSVELSLMLPR